MKVMSLFAGIGGFDLAAKWMGWQTTVQVEIDEWCRKVLAKNFPNVYRYDDIKTFDGSPFAGSIDLICGGFPCQPYSTAGKRLGKADNRHLWPYMFRTIQQVKPRWVVGENVSGLLSWNGGLVFREVLADLESEGYQAQVFLIPACGVNAPHKRERIWIIAHRSDARSEGLQFGGKDSVYGLDIASNTNRSGYTKSIAPDLAARSGLCARRNTTYWSDWPTQSPLCTGNDGVSSRLVRSARFRALARWRTQTIKAAGNAVVPQVVYRIFRAIQSIENIST